MKTTVNPPSLAHNAAFSQAIVVREPAATIYVGGQNALSKDGAIVGTTLRGQTTQALENLEAVLAAAGASIADVVRWGIAIVDGQPVAEGFAAFAGRYGVLPDPPTISVHIVAGLANPAFLVEIDATAVL